MSKLLRRLLTGLLALLVLLLVALGWLAGTEAGLRLLWQQLVRPAVPAIVSGDIRGRLSGSVTLADLRYEDDQLVFAAQSLQLEWTPRGLLDGVLHVRRLAAEGLHYEQLVAGTDEPVALPERVTLPFAIDLQDLSIREAVIINAPGAEPLSLDSLQLAGTFRDTRLDITRLALRRPDLELDGAATLHTADDYVLDGELRWQATLPDYAPLAAQTRLSGSLRALQIEQVLAAPYALQASVLLSEPLTALQLDATIELQDSDLTAINAAWPDMHLAGTLAASGPPDVLQLNGTIDIRDAMAAALQLVFAGNLQSTNLQVETLELSSPGRPARLDAHGSIGLGAAPEFDFQAQWQSLAWPLEGPAEYRSKQGRFTLTGTPDAYRLDASGDLKVQEMLTGDVALRARSGSDPGSWQIDTASLSRGSARLKAAGLVGNRYDLDWQVDAPRLADISPQATGSLRGTGKLRGRLPGLAISMNAQGSGIGFQGYRVGTLAVDGDVRLDEGQLSRLQARLADATIAGIGITSLDVEGSGTTAQHSLKLLVDSDQGRSDLAVTGRWDGATWYFNLPQASLAYQKLAPWQLQQALSGELTRSRLQLAEHCWGSGAARACGRFAGTPDEFTGTFSLADLPLTYFAAVLPRNLEPEGVIQAQGDFGKLARQAATINVRIDSSAATLGLPLEEGGERRRIGLAPGQAVFALAQQRAQLSVELPFATEQGGINSKIMLHAPADGDWLQGKLDGEVTLNWPDIGLAANWLPEVDKLRGRIDGRMQLAGTPAAPRLLGRLALTEASATLITPGLLLEDVSLELAGQPDGDVRVTSSLRSGGGQLGVDGVLNPLERSADLALRGKEFQVMNTPEAQIFVSPDLQLTASSEQAVISGQIDVPRTQLRPRKLPASAVSVSPDQVIVSTDATAGEQVRYPVEAKVRIVLGDKVDIDGFGLSGRLQGNVLLVDLPGKPTSANGEFSIIDGRYEAYGQQLDIRTGRVLFAGGDVTQPGVDIEAVRKPAPDVLVGVKVRGNLQKPKFTVFSEPVMPQSAQLSWLVLGRPLEDGASDSERSAMQSAALMLGMSGGESIGKRLGEQLGLDEVSIGSEAGADESQASLLVGKYLTPELFVSYGIGLFEPVTTLRLRYTLSSRWKLVGSATALQSSADLIYVIERRK